jgi:hypothetical protein
VWSLGLLAIFPFESLASIITAFGALLTAVGGIVMATSAVMRARAETRRDADAECAERLKSTRRELEEMAYELHTVRMKNIELEAAGEPGGVYRAPGEDA